MKKILLLVFKSVCLAEFINKRESVLMSEKTDPNNFNESAGDLSAAQWMRDNLEAIAGYNADVEKNGVFGDSWRGQL
jgi:post-segregation antitoxin (ccd killing protein)